MPLQALCRPHDLGERRRPSCTLVNPLCSRAPPRPALRAAGRGRRRAGRLRDLYGAGRLGEHRRGHRGRDGPPGRRELRRPLRLRAPTSSRRRSGPAGTTPTWAARPAASTRSQELALPLRLVHHGTVLDANGRPYQRRAQPRSALHLLHVGAADPPGPDVRLPVRPLGGGLGRPGSRRTPRRSGPRPCPTLLLSDHGAARPLQSRRGRRRQGPRLPGHQIATDAAGNRRQRPRPCCWHLERQQDVPLRQRLVVYGPGDFTPPRHAHRCSTAPTPTRSQHLQGAARQRRRLAAVDRLAVQLRRTVERMRARARLPPVRLHLGDVEQQGRS